MNKAFIFDMDGVIVNSEPIWEVYEQKFLPKIMGESTYLKIKNQILGNSVSGIYKTAIRHGAKMNKDEFEKIYDEYAEIVYKKANITEGIDELIIRLNSMEFKLGLVSSSRQYWIDLAMKKFNTKNLFQLVMSLDGETTRSKPFPDGYIKAMKKLNCTPNRTMILEDSQKGVNAAKASGALTICLQEHLAQNYLPKNADIYVKSITELIEKIDDITTARGFQ